MLDVHDMEQKQATMNMFVADWSDFNLSVDEHTHCVLECVSVLNFIKCSVSQHQKLFLDENIPHNDVVTLLKFKRKLLGSVVGTPLCEHVDDQGLPCFYHCARGRKMCCTHIKN